MELVESRQFKVPKSRINKWAENVGLPKDAAVSTAERAETSISEDNDAADNDAQSEANTFDSGMVAFENHFF